MKKTNHLLLIWVLAIACHGCCFNQSSTSQSIDEKVKQRENLMLSDMRQYLINVEKGEFLDSCTKALDDTADFYRTKIISTLSSSALEAYKTERESYDAWRAFQATISSEVVSDVYQLYAGGSAGASFEMRHHYDIANINATEQEIFYDALSNTSFAVPYKDDATFCQIDSAKIQMCTDIRDMYYQHDDIGPDGYPVVCNTPEKIKSFIDKDFELFQKWMTDREKLASLLTKKVRVIYETNTAYWRHVWLEKYLGHYINKRD